MELNPASNSKNLFQLAAGPLLNEVQTAFGHSRQVDYLLASNVRRQVWHFWLNARSAELSRDVASHLMCTKSKALIIEALERMGRDDVCPGLLGALGKLGPFALSKKTYQHLCEILLERGKGAKIIMHRDALTSQLIDRLHMLPDPMRRVGIVVGDHVDVEELERLAFILQRQPDLMSHVENTELGDVGSIVGMLIDQVQNRPQNGRLPLVWKGNGDIRPVLSSSELKRLAVEMNNCLESCWSKLHRGELSLFVLIGEVPVAICFGKLDGLGWQLEQVRGPGNRLPTRAEYQRIRHAFASRPDFFIPKEHLVNRVLGRRSYAA